MNINSKTTKAELEAYIAKLEAELARKNSAEEEKAETAQVVAEKPSIQPVVNVTIPTTDVVLVYTSESAGYIKTTNVELYCNVYGEEFTLTKGQFDEVAGKYRDWFQRGVLAVSSKNMDVAVAKGLPTDKDNVLTKEELNKLGKMSPEEIEELWNKFKLKEQKQSVVCYVKRKFIENDPAFRNRQIVDLFNRLTEGSFRREQDELDGRYKYRQIDVD